MDHSALLIAQLTDVFRIGLLAGLVYTMERTRAQTGVAIPLLAGIVFVSVIIATVMPIAGVPILQAILSGILANAVISSVLWLLWTAIRKRL
ncbi:MAG: hypothetical protein ACKVP5_16485 [Aestuariivirga sp.]